MNAWLQDGKVLLDSGKVVLCDHCPCEMGITVPCCPNPIPRTLHITFHADWPPYCVGLNGQTFTLTWSATDQRWEWTGTYPDSIVLTPCDALSGNLWPILVDVGGIQTVEVPNYTGTMVNCDPIQIEGGGGCLAGLGGTWTITE